MGYGWLDGSINIPGYATETYKDDAALAALKFGFGGETVFTGLSWNVMATFIGLNAEKDADLQGSYGIDFGLKYTF